VGNGVGGGGGFKSKQAEFRKACKEVRTETRRMKAKWMDDRAAQLQEFSDRHDSRAMFEIMKFADGVKISGTGAVKSKAGIVLTERAEKQARWVEHYSELLNLPSEVDMEAVARLEQRPIFEMLAADISLAEVKKAAQQMKNEKAAGMDGIPADVFKYGGERLLEVLHRVIQKVWEGGEVPQAWKDAMICSLFKKGDRAVCGNFRGISLLATAGKLLTRIIITRLAKHCECLLPETQCGFRKGRSTIDMLFCARLTQEKCAEFRVDMWAVFVDLTKAYDTVNRKGLFAILQRMGIPAKMLSVIQSLHDGMRATVLSEGEPSEWFNIKNGLRQGCVMAPNLFAIFLAAVMAEAFDDGDEPEEGEGIYIKFRMSGKLHNVRGLKAKTRTSLELLRELLYADDMGIFCHSERALQTACDKLAAAIKAYGLIISLGKTEVMVQRAPRATEDTRDAEAAVEAIAVATAAAEVAETVAAEAMRNEAGATRIAGTIRTTVAARSVAMAERAAEAERKAKEATKAIEAARVARAVTEEAVAAAAVVEAAAAATVALIPPPKITINGTTLKNVPRFVYLGGGLSEDGSMDGELRTRISKAAYVFGKLAVKVWRQQGIRVATKVAIYKATVLPTLLYGCETWAVRQDQVAKLDTFHHRKLREILGIKWQELVTTSEVLRRTGMVRIDTMIRQARLTWLGHVGRMDDARLPKRLMQSELVAGKRRAGGQRLRWSDAVYGDLEKFEVGHRKHETWMKDCQNRSAWRAAVKKGAKQHHKALNEAAARKRQVRKDAEARHGNTLLKGNRAARVTRAQDGRDGRAGARNGNGQR
jgi:hypothetical protein